MFAGHRQGFCCSHWKRELTQRRPLLPLMMQVVSMALGLVSTQALLISCSTHSSKLPFIQKAVSVVVQLCEERREGRMHETKLIFKQMPPPHFCLEVVCKKGGGVISGAYGTQILHTQVTTTQVTALWSSCWSHYHSNLYSNSTTLGKWRKTKTS